MDLLQSNFTDSHYPHKWLMTIHDDGAFGLLYRVKQAIENLGIDAKIAEKHVPAHESEDGQAHYLLAIATTRLEDYEEIVAEVDRISAEIDKKNENQTTRTGATREDVLMRYYAQQAEYEGPPSEGAPYRMAEHPGVRRYMEGGNTAVTPSAAGTNDDEMDEEPEESELDAARRAVMARYEKQVKRESKRAQQERDRDRDDYELEL